MDGRRAEIASRCSIRAMDEQSRRRPSDVSAITKDRSTNSSRLSCSRCGDVGSCVYVRR